MAITSSVRPSYAWRMIILAVLCVAFGLWGVYDYAIAIPAAQQRYDRYQVLEATRYALEAPPGTPDYRETQEAATTAILGELAPLIEEAAAGANVTAIAVDHPNHPAWVTMLFINTADDTHVPDQGLGQMNDDAESVVERVRAGDEFAWFRGLLLSAVAIDDLKRRPRPAGTALNGVPLMAHDYVTKRIDEVGGAPKKPSKFDRATQWAFILCLPCAPYFLVLYRRAKAKTYKLEDDGSLVTPEGTWASDEIKDIDMSRWMAKSIATVSTRDGKEVKLDDYLYKGMDQIIGVLARERHPDDWDENAKPLKGGKPVRHEEPEPLPPEEAPVIPDSATIDPTDRT